MFLTVAIWDATEGLDPVTRMQQVDLNLWLAGDILLKADKMSMAHSMELRVPFLDREVWALAAALPELAGACGLAIGVQLDGNAIGGAVLRVQITAAAGGGFLLGAAGGVGLLYMGCSLIGRGLGGCIEHRGGCQCRHRQQGQQHTAGQQDAYNAFGFHIVSLHTSGFYTGCRYHKYTIN